MRQTRNHFGMGLAAGIILAALFFQFFAPRYAVIKTGDMLVKQDKWSGRSWQYDGDGWKEIEELAVDWKPVDRALVKALNLPGKEKDGAFSARISSLKEKYPVLESVSDDDIMERIKYIYARKIMVDLYFNKAGLN